ncbi:DUF2612 domain-containing protein [Serratia microhaemolytica]|uniref:DUF2612 domain-containing protein n=1 Tax=Serratia microhaemolytica TaxID=2675110 RepID=UPI000FDEEA22|nr:DUF2612 domain-containing protein [Serratia microhaemolytica]
MTSKVPEPDSSVNLLRSIIWQYDSSEALNTIISKKNGWYENEQTKYWDDWYRDVFDLKTANDFGLQIWSIILGVSFIAEGYPDIELTTEQKRFVCRLRYYQLITRATIPEVNGIMKDMFTTEKGKAYALDPNDMSCILYVFTYQPDEALAFILLKYDLLPRPATVGLGFRIIRYRPFGFGHHNHNFGHAPFYDGGKLTWPYKKETA